MEALQPFALPNPIQVSNVLMMQKFLLWVLIADAGIIQACRLTTTGKSCEPADKVPSQIAVWQWILTHYEPHLRFWHADNIIAILTKLNIHIQRRYISKYKLQGQAVMSIYTLATSGCPLKDLG